MKIQAINSANSVLGCQPIKQVEFAKRRTPEIRGFVVENPDIYIPEEPTVIEQKYDLACRLAAYYKTQYENLLKNGSVVA